jgi:ribonuclease HI
MSAHFRSIVEDPWLHGHTVVLDRSDRRALRSQAPELPSNCLIYFFDGASRKTEGGRSASFGALLRVDGVTVARYAEYLGEWTNNETEYAGALAVLEHALSQQCPRVCIFGDSKLVVSQLNGNWKCKASNLIQYYERGLELMRRLHDACASGFFVFGHVYREFNADADSLANVALDQRTAGTTVVVDDAWRGPPIRLA